MINLKTKLGASLLLAASASMAHATTYDVSAVFSDGGIQGVTQFNGSFDWNGTSVSNFTGLLSESMYGWNGSYFDSNGTAAGGVNAAAYSGNVYAKPGGYANNEAPLLNLTNQLASSTSGGLVTVSAFLQNSTDVVSGGGYNVTGGNAMTFGNNNAFFTLTFDASNPLNTTSTWSQSVYGDFTALGVMGPMLTGSVGMTGYLAGGSMGGMPISLSVAAVPLPAAVWLFSGALMGLFGVSRRKFVLPA